MIFWPLTLRCPHFQAQYEILRLCRLVFSFFSRALCMVLFGVITVPT